MLVAGKRPAHTRQGDVGIKEFIEKEFPDNAIMAEVGVYKGDSAIIWLNSGKVKTLYCVDPWENFYSKVDLAAYSCDMKIIEKMFDEKILPYKEKVIKHKEGSPMAASKYPDEFFDIVYIDACHDELAAKADVLAWIPKIKKGGIISGHDWRDRCKIGIAAGMYELLHKGPDKLYRDSSWMARV
jgi:hypothetical protein